MYESMGRPNGNNGKKSFHSIDEEENELNNFSLESAPSTNI